MYNRSVTLSRVQLFTHSFYHELQLFISSKPLYPNRFFKLIVINLGLIFYTVRLRKVSISASHSRSSKRALRRWGCQSASVTCLGAHLKQTFAKPSSPKIYAALSRLIPRCLAFNSDYAIISDQFLDPSTVFKIKNS